MSDISKDIIESFKSQINERLASPLTGSFTIAWLIWNYKFIVILVSANSVTKTFDLIHKICFPDLYAVALNGFLYPLMSALFYIFVLPYPASWAYSFSRIRQKVLAEIRQKVDDETPLPNAEAIVLRRELSEKDQALDQAFLKSKAEIAQLRSDLAGANAQIQMYLNSSAYSFKPSDSHILLLKAISDTDFRATRDMFLENLNFPALELDYMLNDLEIHNCISSRVNGDEKVFGIAQEGRRHLLESQKSWLKEFKQ